MKRKCPCNDMMCVHVSVIIELVNHFRGKTKEWRDFIFCSCSFLVSMVTFHTFMSCWQQQWKDKWSVAIRLYLLTLMTFAFIIKQSYLGCLWSWWRDSSSGMWQTQRHTNATPPCSCTCSWMQPPAHRHQGCYEWTLDKTTIPKQTSAPWRLHSGYTRF